MKKLAAALLGTSLAIGAASAARAAAAPRVFEASGVFRSQSGADSQNVQLTIGYQAGHVRIETSSRDAGKSIILATKGKDDVAMLDPAQKVVVHMKPSALAAANGGSSADLTGFQSMLDPTGLKAFVLEHGHRVGPGPGILGHPTTVYEAQRKGNDMKVWMANDLSLPLKIEGHSTAGSRFDVDITRLNLHPRFSRHYFDDKPPGYTDIQAQSNSINQ